MNFLAHAVLSFGDPEILVGNMISDFVKGRKQFDYPPRVHQGIRLHRQIDTFTDEHPLTRTAKQFFREDYRLYSGAFVDVAFDHFLAIDGSEFPPGELFTFSQQVYGVLHRHMSILPPGFGRMMPYMIRDNWLANYASIQGIGMSFGGLVRRSAYLDDPLPAVRVLDRHYAQLQACFRDFWPMLKDMARAQFLLLNES